MRALTVAALIAVLLSTSACAPTKRKLLTDNELAQIRAGTDLCGLLGINGPCVGSFLEAFDPALRASPTSPIQDPFTSIVVSPLPESGSVTLQQSYTVGGPSTLQSISQQNSASQAPGSPQFFRSPDSSLLRWHLPYISK